MQGGAFSKWSEEDREKFGAIARKKQSVEMAFAELRETFPGRSLNGLRGELERQFREGTLARGGSAGKLYARIGVEVRKEAAPKADDYLPSPECAKRAGYLGDSSISQLWAKGKVDRKPNPKHAGKYLYKLSDVMKCAAEGKPHARRPRKRKGHVPAPVAKKKSNGVSTHSKTKNGTYNPLTPVAVSDLAVWANYSAKFGHMPAERAAEILDAVEVVQHVMREAPAALESFSTVLDLITLRVTK